MRISEKEAKKLIKAFEGGQVKTIGDASELLKIKPKKLLSLGR